MYSICRAVGVINVISVLHYAHASAVGVLFQRIPYASAVGVINVISVLHYALASAVGVLFQCIPYASAVGVLF